MINPWAMDVGYSGYLDPNATASLTPEQQQRRRQMLYAQALMGQANGQPQRSVWGGVNQAVLPILGAAMYRNAQQPQMAQADSSNAVWNPNNPVGTSTLGGATANQGSWLGNLSASVFG